MDPSTLDIGVVVKHPALGVRTIWGISRGPDGTFVQFVAGGPWVNATDLVAPDAPDGATDTPLASLEPDGTGFEE